MTKPPTRAAGALIFAAAFLAPAVSHYALGSGRGIAVSLVLAGAQAVAFGVVLRTVLGGWLGGAVALLSLAALGLAAADSARTGLLVAAGLAHALLYGAMLAIFGASLRPGRVSVVTRLAQRINPHFRPGMIPYTRAVTRAWCVFAAGQLAASALLLAFGPLGWWLALVGGLHGLMALALALSEFLIRRRRFPGEHTGFAEMVRGLHAGAAGPRSGANSSRTGADCPGRSGNATPRPAPGADSAPGPAA